MLTSYLFDTYSAPQAAAAASTGNAARSVGRLAARQPDQPLSARRRRPRPRTSSRSVASGLYVTELMGFGVNPVTGDYSRGASGLWIENGELAYPVERDHHRRQSAADVQDIEVVGSDLVLRHSVAAPTMKIAKLTVAGN